jgi:hypothetical protein
MGPAGDKHVSKKKKRQAALITIGLISLGLIRLRL